jgi:hypothetical protein
MSTNDQTPKPTIEERLEAVVETLELVAAMQRDHEKALESANRKWDERFDKLMSAVETLTQVAQSHERRLSGLEGQ